jgi:glycosyltransferase involved in cell wall biosynthesis
VGPIIKEKIISLGIAPENIEVIPSFIPPTVREEEIAEIPKRVWEFIDSHNPVISANAYRIIFYNNQDLYGIDMCVDLCANLGQYYPRIGLVFCLPDVGDYEYFKKMKQRIADRGIENNFLFITEQHQLYPIIMKSDVFLRPTNVDGYGVSIAESIYFKLPAVASDVCPRSEGTILFKSRDINDFTLKVKDVLDNHEQHKKKLDAIELGDNSKKIIKIYQKLRS